MFLGQASQNLPLSLPEAFCAPEQSVPSPGPGSGEGWVSPHGAAPLEICGALGSVLKLPLVQ